MGDKGTLWLPPQASTMAGEIDWLFYFVYWISIVIFAMVILSMVYFVVKYRRKDRDEVPGHVEESMLIEASWVVIPTILCMVVFTWGFQSFIKMSVAPPNAYEIQVYGKKWLWDFEYPDGTKTVGELHVPADRPVRLLMSSEDVLHSFFIPAFRVKHDVLPNRYTAVWFTATTEGEYQVFCTEYCGTSHSGMLAKVFVHEEQDFQEWLASAGGDDDLPLPELGAKLYQQQVCYTCHSVDGSAGVAPTFQGLYGAQRTFEGGGSAEADDNYLRESILEPGANLVTGYANVMPASYGGLSERELSALIAFIKEQQ